MGPTAAPDEPSTSPHDPRTVPDLNRRAELEHLGDRIAELSARIQAATYELLVLIREFDARTGWSGCTSCAHWLSWRTGLAPGAAREHVRVARALGKLPKLSDAMRRGVVSYSKVRAVTRVATPETEQALLDVAKCGTAAHVEQVVRGWRRVDRIAEKTEERRRHETRSLRTWVDDDGMVLVQGRLTPEVGVVLRRALEAACDQMKMRRSPAADGPSDAAENAVAEALTQDAVAVDEELAPTFAQRQADAIGLLAECALAGGLDRGTAGDRYQVVLHVDAGALAEENAGRSRGNVQGRRVGSRGTTRVRSAFPRERTRARSWNPSGTETRDTFPRERRRRRTCVAQASASTHSQTVLDEAGGIHVAAETARRLACDAALVEMQHGPAGEILDVGRRTRTISPALRRALAARDRQCRFPGCQNRRCDAHHVEHWADGGRDQGSTTSSCCAGATTGWCTRRGSASRWMQRARWSSYGRTGGRSRRRRCRRFGAGAPLAPVTERLDQEGVTIDAQTATPAWKGERMDINWVVDSLWRPRSEELGAPG